jgi:uncharacterized protein (TIGR03000 family)
MYRRYLGISALALAGVLVLADNAMAQRRLGGYYDGGYWGGRGGDGYYGGRGWYDGGYYGGRGRGWDGGRFYGNGSAMYDNGNVYGDSYYDDGSYGGRRGRLFGRRGGYAYGSYAYGGGGCHGGCHGYGAGCSGGYYGAGCSGGYYGSGCSGGSYYGSSANGSSYGAMATNGGALIELKVPADATVTFDGQPTQQTGEIRDFLTPPLEANKNFSYQVHVKAQNMDETRKINVNADRRVTMDFTMPQGAEGQRASPEQGPAPGRRERAPAPARQPAYGATELGAPPRPLAGEGNTPQANAEVHEGQFLSFSNGTLEMTDPEHGKHTHHLSADTKVFIDGQPAKAEDLKADMKIKVSNKKGDQQTITRIDAQSKGGNGNQPRSNRGAQPKEAPPPQP